MLISNISGRPIVPVDVEEAIILWFRAWGRGARVEWSEPLGCFVIHASRKSDDPVMRLWQEGKLAEEPTEVIYLHEPNPRGPGFVAIDPGMLGPAGVRTWLDERNLWSGRGEFRSIQDAVERVTEANDRLEAERMNGERGREAAWLVRRKALQLPLISVPKDIH